MGAVQRQQEVGREAVVALREDGAFQRWVRQSDSSDIPHDRPLKTALDQELPESWARLQRQQEQQQQQQKERRQQRQAQEAQSGWEAGRQGVETRDQTTGDPRTYKAGSQQVQQIQWVYPYERAGPETANIRLFVAVITSGANRHLRDAIRATWGADTRRTPQPPPPPPPPSLHNTRPSFAPVPPYLRKLAASREEAQR